MLDIYWVAASSCKLKMNIYILVIIYGTLYFLKLNPANFCFMYKDVEWKYYE